MMSDAASDQLAAFRWVNVRGTERLAKMAAASGCRRFVFMSSIKVNGEGTETGGQKSVVKDHKADLKGAFSEKDTPEPLDPYGISKWEAEQVLQEIAKTTGLEVVVLRPPLVYGPGVKANFYRLMRIVDWGLPIPLSNVNNRISLIYLENLVDAVFACLTHSEAAGQTYLVSDGEDVSTPELIRRISSSLGRPARLFPFPPVMLKMVGIITGKSISIDKLLHSLTIDCSKIRRELGWQAPFSMEQGLIETANWYMKKDLQ
jgi:nucleoside-diphosphate-sugar epimerase